MTRITRILAVSLVFVLMPQDRSAAQSGDAEAGKQKSATCQACHGPDGNSPLDQFPKIAGQVMGYNAIQLAKFKSGERNNPVMAGMVAGLDEQAMADLDAYYATQTMSQESITADQEEDARAGEAIYRGGVAEYSIPACIGCHGPTGSGVPPSFPRLAGQFPAYIESQLLAFKSGARANPIMQPIAFPLSEQQIKQLALYISALH